MDSEKEEAQGFTYLSLTATAGMSFYLSELNYHRRRGMRINGAWGSALPKSCSQFSDFFPRIVHQFWEKKKEDQNKVANFIK